MNNKETYNRMLYIDILNVVSCLAVVFLHTNEMFWAFSYEPYWISANIIECVFYYAVPVFFMITGTTLIDYRKKYNTKEFFCKRISKTIIPFLIWSIIAVFYYKIMKKTNLTTDSLNAILDGIINTKYVPIYWYFISLIPVYLSIPVLSLIPDEQKKSAYFYIVILTFVFNSLIPLISEITGNRFVSNPGLRMPLGGGYLFYALLGYLLSHSDLKRYKKWIYLLGIVGLTIHIIGTWYLSYRIGDIGRTFKGYLNVPYILYSIAVFTFFKERDYGKCNFKIFKFVKYFSGTTFGIYLMHWFILDIFKQVTGGRFSKMLSYRIVGAIIIFSICGIFIKNVQKNKIVKKIIFP